MYVYKCIQSRSTGEFLTYIIRKRPMLIGDAAWMHYRIINHWYIETLGG